MRALNNEESGHHGNQERPVAEPASAGEQVLRHSLPRAMTIVLDTTPKSMTSTVLVDSAACGVIEMQTGLTGCLVECKLIGSIEVKGDATKRSAARAVRV